MNSLSHLSSSVKSGYDAVCKYTQTLALATLLGGGVVTESCQQPDKEIVTPVAPNYIPYTPYTAKNEDIGSFTGFFDTNKLLIPTDDVKLTLNFAKGSSVEQKLLPVINQNFKSIVELHGSSFASLEDFLGFMTQNKDKFPMGFSIVAYTPDGNYGYGGLRQYFDDISRIKNVNIPVLSILKSINDKASEKDKFFKEVIDLQGKTTVVTSQPCTFSLSIYVNNASGFDSKSFFTIKFVHNGEVWFMTPLGDMITMNLK